MNVTDDEFEDLDELHMSGIASLEHRRDLEIKRNFGVRVEVDLTDKNTSLFAYVHATRARAVKALEQLASVSATDPMAITRLQAVVTQYLDVRDWARGVIEDSKDADDILQGGLNGDV